MLEKGQVILYPIWGVYDPFWEWFNLFIKIYIPYFEVKVRLCMCLPHLAQELTQKNRGTTSVIIQIVKKY